MNQQHEPTHRPTNALLWLALICSALPFLTATVAPLCDMPNHLARIHVLANYGEERIYSDFYTIDLQVLPNLALDAIATPLAKLVGTPMAGTLFLIGTGVITVLGAGWVAAAQSRSAGVAAALAALFFHTIALEYGLVNFVFGSGFMLLAFGAWIATRERSPFLRIAVSVPFATLLFFTHLMPLAFYAVLVFAYEMARANRREGLREPFPAVAVATGTQFVIPAVLYLGFSPTRSELGGWQFPSAVKKLSQIGSTFMIGDGVADLVFSAAVALVAVVIVIVARPRFGRGGLVALLALAVLFALTPQRTATADNISLRIPPVLALVIAAFVELRPRSRRLATLATTLIAALLVGRTAQISVKWLREAPEYDAILEAAKKIPPGSTLFTLRDPEHRVRIRQTWHPPLAHAAGLAMLEQPLWLPQLFANDGQQPLVVRSPSLLAMRMPRGDFMPTYHSPVDFAEWLRVFRELHSEREVYYHSAAGVAPVCVLHVHGTLAESLPTQGLTLLGSGYRWNLWQLPR